MSTLKVPDFQLPPDIHTLEGFRRWVAALDERAPRVHFSRGRVHIEMSPQKYESHGHPAQGINKVLAALSDELDLGRYYFPPSWITHEPSGLSTEPDGFLVLWPALASGRVRVNPDRGTELLGRPDMVLEVVSKASRRKDLVELVEDYARAGVPEYWIVDARGEPLVFRILVLEAEGAYADQTADAEGWLTSPSWGRLFRLVRFTDRAGLTDYRLEVRLPDDQRT